MEILRNKEKGYFYIWDNVNNAQLCDDNGAPLTFKTLEQAREYLGGLDD